MENKEKETFNYTYSAKEQAEIQNIRKKYVAPEKQGDKMEQLRRLDAKVSSKASTAALVIGIIGALIMGLGMSLIMSNFGKFLGWDSVTSLVIGIIFGVIGIVLVCLAYPVYDRVIKTEREKIAPEIIRLTDELMK